MKKLFQLLMILFVSFSAKAQLPTMNLKLHVETATGGPLSNTLVEFVEINTRQRYSAKTNSSGLATVTLEGGKYWQIQILDIKDYYMWQLTMHDKPVTSNVEFTITYDLKHYLRETEPVLDRTGIVFKEEKQNYSSSTAPKPNNILLVLNLKKLAGGNNVGTKVILVDVKGATKYSAVTNVKGEAVYMLPVKTKFQLDVDKIENFGYFDSPERAGMIARVFYTYEPTIVNETNKNDTIIQKLALNQGGTTDRELVTLKVIGGQDGVYTQTPVYLQEINGTLVYKALTNQSGEAVFLLPKGKKYMIHFDYQKDVDVFDLTRSHGIGHSNKTRHYMPEARLQFPETFIPGPEQLYVKAFNKFLTKQFQHQDTTKALDFKAYFGNEVNVYSKEAVMNIEITTYPVQDYAKSPSVNLAFVIDKSGSMSGYDRIENLKKAMYEVIEKMRPEDVVSIVVFESNETVLLPAQKIGLDKNKIIDQIYKIESDGGTNIYKGLKQGYSEISKNFKKNQTNRVVLLTDGYGETPVDTILNFVKQQKAKGIECSAVGVGDSYNVALLQQIGDLGGGLISLVSNSEEIHEVFVKELSSMVMPIARDVKLEIEYNKKIVFSQLYGYSLDQKSSTKASLKLPNVYAGLSDLAMVRFNLGEVNPAIEKEPVIVRLKYFDVQLNKQVLEEKLIHLKWSDFTGELEMQKDRYNKKLYAIAVMNQSLKVMSESTITKDYARAIKTIEETLASINKAFPKADDVDVAELKQTLEDYLEILKDIK